MTRQERNGLDTSQLGGAGNNVILTRKDNGQPTLVNLFRMITADPIEGGTAIKIDDPKAYAAAATSSGSNYVSAQKEFREISCTRTIQVKESLEEILEKQAAALKLMR